MLSKLLMYSVVLALIAALGLWVMGGYKTENEGSIEIKATPEQVFQFLVDPDKRAKWLLNATKVELKSQPPVGPNSTYVTQHQEGERSYETNDFVLQMVDNEWLSIRMESLTSRLVTMFKLAKSGGQTNLKYKVSELPTNLYRVLAPFRKLDLQGRIDEELVRIKRLVEEAAQSEPESVPEAAVESADDKTAEESPATESAEKSDTGN